MNNSKVYLLSLVISCSFLGNSLFISSHATDPCDSSEGRTCPYQGNTRGGTRGDDIICEQDAKRKLLLLAPQAYVGTSAMPKDLAVYWIPETGTVSNQRPVQFYLSRIASNSDEPAELIHYEEIIYEEAKLENNLDLEIFHIDLSDKNLASGEYKWMVRFLCITDKGEKFVSQSAEIEIITQKDESELPVYDHLHSILESELSPQETKDNFVDYLAGIIKKSRETTNTEDLEEFLEDYRQDIMGD